MKQDNTLSDWRIVYTTIDGDSTAETRWLWMCMAEDAEHAIEQLKNAEEVAEILMVCKDSAFDLMAEREDFVLRNEGRIWLTAQNMSVRLAHIDDELILSVFPLGQEEDDPLVSHTVSVSAPDGAPAH